MSDGVSAEQMTAARDMARLMAAKPEVDNICAQAVADAQNKAMRLIEKQELDGDKAFSLWMEMYQAIKMARRFQLRTQMNENGTFNDNVRAAKAGN